MFEIPSNLPSKQALLKARKRLRQLKIEKWVDRHPTEAMTMLPDTVPSSDARAFAMACLQEKSGDDEKVEEHKRKQVKRGRKDNESCPSAVERAASPLPIPTHRRRTKSFRNLVAKSQIENLRWKEDKPNPCPN